MSPRLRTASWTAALSLLLGAPATAAADEATVGLRLLLQPGDPGGAAPGATPAPAAPVTVIDWSAARTITLPELLQLAVRQAPALQLAELDIEIAEARMEAARSIDDWAVAAGLTASTAATSFQLGELRIVQNRTSVGVNGEIVRLLPTGGSVTLHASSTFNKTSTDNGSTADYTDTITATITQPLLEGRGEFYFRAQQEQTRLNRDLEVVQRESAAIGVVNQVVAAYWGLVYAQRDLEIRRSSLELARERLRITEASIRGGGVAATEALAVEQVIATREEEVLASEIALVERSINLRRLVQMEIGPGALALSVPPGLTIPSQSFDLDAAIADAYQQSPELAQLAVLEENATITVEVAENGLLPSLTASLTAGPTGIDTNAAKAVANMVTFDGFTVVGRLSFSHSLGNHGAAGVAREARASRAVVAVTAIDVRAQIAQTLAQAVVLAESAERRVAIAARAIELAEQNIKAEQARFGLGKATNFDVLTRQEELKQAQLRQARAIVDWHLAATTIAAVTGRILTDYGISLPE